MALLSWFQKLMPREDKFFDLFAAHAATLVAGADALVHLLEGGDTIPKYCRLIDDHEHAADDVTRDVLHAVRRTFITPFDRSAITGLINAMDDSIDEMRKTSKAITLFEVAEFEPQMRAISRIVVQVAELTAEAIPLLRSIGTNGAALHALTEQIVHLEGEADDLHDTGLKALFRAHGESRPMAFIVGREIYNHLEKIVDRFEDVANEIQGIVIDHA